MSDGCIVKRALTLRDRVIESEIHSVAGLCTKSRSRLHPRKHGPI